MLSKYLHFSKYNALLLTGIIVIAISTVIFRGDASRIEKPVPVPPATGTKDDPEARQRYEWMRLRSPLTGEIPANIRSRELAFAATLPTKETYAAVNLDKPGSPGNIQVYNWARRGPYNVGGRTRALALDVSDVTEETIIAGGVSGGIWKSTNGGNSWTKTTAPADLHSVTALVQDMRPGKTGTWYYGTGERRGNSAAGNAFYHGDGIFKSTDGGDTWTQLSSTASGKPQSFDRDFNYVWNVAVDNSNSAEDEVYAATYGSIKRSTDGGTSWTNVRGGPDPWSNYTDVAVSSSGVVYATLSSEGINKGIWRSDDGIVWTDITPSGFPASYRRVVLDIAPSNENIVYFLGHTPGGGQNDHSLWKYTYVSDDGSGLGGTWEDRSTSLPVNILGSDNFSSQGSYDLLIKAKPDDENTVFIGGVHLFRSTNGFATVDSTKWVGGWQYESNFDHHADQHSLVFYPSDPRKMLSGHDGGVSETTDNTASTVTWSALHNGYFTSQFYTIAIDHSAVTAPGKDVIVGGMQDNGTWFTNSTVVTDNWVEVFGGDGAFAAIADGRTYYYVSLQNGITYRLKLDDNGTEDEFTKITPAGASGFIFINPFVLDPNNTDQMYMAGGEVIWWNSDLTQIPARSNDTTSVNWTKLSKTDTTQESISALAVSKTPADRLYFGTAEGSVYRVDNATDVSSTPVNITGADFPTGSSGSYVNSIAVDRANGDNIMVVFANYEIKSLFYSSDGGTSWTNVSGNLEENPDGTGNGPSTRWAVIHSESGGATIYFVGTSTGLYSTFTLAGDSTVWVQEGANEIGNVVVDMLVNRSDGLVVAATHGAGVFSSDVKTSVKDDDIVTTPTRYELSQNYPNPFNPDTKIGYYLPSAEQVNLVIYNSLGQKVRTLLSMESKAAGRHIVNFDGLNDRGISLPTGVYFYRIIAGDFTDVKKMMILK